MKRINSATKQVVAGHKYQINADLIDSDEKSKNCDVTIWSQPWLENGIEVTFECEGEEKLIKKHSVIDAIWWNFGLSEINYLIEQKHTSRSFLSIKISVIFFTLF